MWPPEWSMSESDHQVGENGVLENVQLHYEPTRLISIEASHLGDWKKGVMILEDPAQLDIVFEKLRENLGRPLTEIGYLEIDVTLPLRK